MLLCHDKWKTHLMIVILTDPLYMIDIWVLESVVWSMTDLILLAICSAEIKYNNHSRINSFNYYV
jgi:hypothetical protein